ncbi:MAG: class C sortase [Bariatricus sp.]
MRVRSKKKKNTIGKKRKINVSGILLIVIFMIGLSLLLYPSVSNWWNMRVQTRVVNYYDTVVAELDEGTNREIWDQAVLYNEKIAEKGIDFRTTLEEHEEYEKILNLNDNGMMAYIEIPKIKVKLPVCHGADENVLQNGVGHLEGSSLPVGGDSSHCVLSGHRGLPSARLFTDLDQLEEGDYFVIHILNQTLTYAVDQIRIVEPDEVDVLQIEEGKDLCTLVTCTPYGINTQRLLVRGHRTANINEVDVDSNAFVVDPMLVATVVAAFILLVLMIWLLWSTRNNKKK